jgi:hypothetical protein
MKRVLLPLAIAGVFTSGCATTYDPAEVCTANWIQPRAEQAVGFIQSDTESVIKNLRKVAEGYMDGKTPGPFQLLALTGSVKKLESELKNGRGMKDLKVLARTCDDPKILTTAMSGYMRNQGLPPGMVNFIENLDLYKDILENAVAGIGS